MNHLSALSTHTKPSSSSFRIYLRPYIWAIFQDNNTDDTTGKYLNLEGTSIYINPEGFDHLRDTVEKDKFDDQVVSIEHLDVGKYSIWYSHCELDGEYAIMYDTVDSLKEITNNQLSLITILWSQEISWFDTAHFMEKLNLACGIIKTWPIFPSLAIKVSETLG